MYDMTFHTLIKLQKRQHSSNLTTRVALSYGAESDVGAQNGC